MKRYIVEPMDDIITLSKIIVVKNDDADDDNMTDEGGLDPGKYAFDSLGQFWVRQEGITEVIALFDLDDKVRQQERNESRARYQKKKTERKKRKREDA